MAEIVKPGTKDHVTCGSCDAVIRFTASDVRRRTDPPRGPHDVDDTEIHEITCPECHASINVGRHMSGETGRRVRERTIDHRYTDDT